MALFYTKFATQPMHHRATIHVTQASTRRNSRRDWRSTGADESDLLTQSCQLSYVATGRSISTWRKRREAELRTRIAEHRSG